jgi:phosphatidate cytidylyltransferase
LRQLGGDTSDLGRNWLLVALLVTFATDSGAFLVGKNLGRRPLAPRISPSKTWEGAIGGFLLAVATALVLGQFLELGLSRWQTGLIGATVGMVSQLGDLFESKLKRISQVKDAGSIIPGHGGMLDRLDSLLFSIPAVYYLVNVVFSP